VDIEETALFRKFLSTFLTHALCLNWCSKKLILTVRAGLKQYGEAICEIDRRRMSETFEDSVLSEFLIYW